MSVARASGHRSGSDDHNDGKGAERRGKAEHGRREPANRSAAMTGTNKLTPRSV
jgi:hypothetical protein